MTGEHRIVFEQCLEALEKRGWSRLAIENYLEVEPGTIDLSLSEEWWVHDSGWIREGTFWRVINLERTRVRPPKTNPRLGRRRAS